MTSKANKVAALRAKGKTPRGHFEHPTQRRSLSGKLVDLPPAKPWWLYKPTDVVEPTPRTGAFYAIEQPKSEPVMLCECRQPINDGLECPITLSDEHMSTAFSGLNRRERRRRGERSGYTRRLQLRLGQA